MRLLLVLACMCASESAQAHFFPSNLGPAAGFLHPLLGPDHLLAMFSVGALSVSLRKSAIWMLPATFVIAMVFDGALGLNGIEVAHGEFGVSTSVAALGVCLALGRPTPWWLAYPMVAFFGFLHGHVHGIEAPAHNRDLYLLGFVTSTIGLHLIGVLSGLIAQEYRRGREVVRGFGAVVSLVGLYFIVG
jgi:urease accessory protein